VNSATVAGGNGNTASGSDSTVAGGYLNTASGRNSAVVGGSSNTASGSESVAAGLQSKASGAVSFAGGNRAVADDPHSFLWNDGNFFGSAIYGTVCSPAANSFSAHATGGFNFWTNPSGPITGCWIAQVGGSMNAPAAAR